MNIEEQIKIDSFKGGLDNAQKLFYVTILVSAAIYFYLPNIDLMTQESHALPLLDVSISSASTFGLLLGALYFLTGVLCYFMTCRALFAWRSIDDKQVASTLLRYHPSLMLAGLWVRAVAYGVLLVVAFTLVKAVSKYSSSYLLITLAVVVAVPYSMTANILSKFEFND